jgi:hypothetical protein
VTNALARGIIPDDVKVYVITFAVAGVNLQSLNQYLYDSVDIIAFWNYVPLVYCVKSRLSSGELAIKLTPFFPHGQFFIAEINRSNINGILPTPAWDWFYLDHHEKNHPPAPMGVLPSFGLAGVGVLPGASPWLLPKK